MGEKYLRNGKHLVKGSPVNPDWQAQMGLWFLTLHCALIPQVLGHGSLHLWLMQAWFGEHSELTMHSGRQFGGLPLKFGRHEHTALLLTSLH